MDTISSNMEQHQQDNMRAHDGTGRHTGTDGAAFVPETCADLLGELRRAQDLAPDYTAVYDAFNATFMKCLDMNTEHTRITLAGTFAKTDYLLKAGHASREMRTAVNRTRARLRKRAGTHSEILAAAHRHDFMTLCSFVAFVYGSDVPQEFVRLFPDTPAQKHDTPEDTRRQYIRVIANRLDDDYIYAETAAGDGGEIKICYTSGSRAYDYDRTYLRDIVREGTQLNIIRPREENGTVYPELIIFEPDNLVDISAVARCFESYAESPTVNLLRRLEPPVCSEAVMLGNFAGQLLDEATRPDSRHNTYAESASAFFRDNAMRLLTTPVTPSFHNSAREQKRNIGHAMNDMLPDAVERFDPADGFVEPSFFSEMLGLQGRMDYIQMDQGVIIEQKSGKGGFPYDSFTRPRHREEHYVQLLMYMLIFRYNYRDKYERNNRELFAFLLYSKYKEGLLGLGFAPELVFRALKVRNLMVWTDIGCATRDGFRMLDGMTAESINMKKAGGRLWEEFQKPRIEALLAPIRQASGLEKEYYFRFLTFIANEHLMAKLGSRTKENSGFAAIWHNTLQEKLQAGNIYCGLTLTSPDGDTDGRVETVTLRLADDGAGDMSNFRKGDIVILYPYPRGSEPDARAHMVFRCTIDNISADSIRLSLRNAQTCAGVFLRDRESLWAVEHDFFESSYNSLYSGMHAFLSAPKDRRDLILMQRKPETDDIIRLKGDYGDFNGMALRVKQARDMFLVIGPPGTGKTSFGMLNTVKEELLEEDSSVLVLSYTNRAVDEICGKLTEAGIGFIRIGGRFGCDGAYAGSLFDTKATACGNITDVKKLVSSARVLVGTTTALNSHIAIFGIKQFTLAVIDEASQILEPHLIGLLSAHNDGVPAIRKFVMIGDHKQLPAVVQQGQDISRVADRALNAIGLTDCRLSLFERLLKRYREDNGVTFMLDRQGRMHPEIALFPNTAFYNGRLKAVPLAHQTEQLPAVDDTRDGIERMLRTRRVAFVATDMPVRPVSDKVNTVEAEMIAATAARIYGIEKDRFDTDRTMGIIVPYRNQIATIRNCIAKYGIDELNDITIDTVERYQGSQRRYIIYGFTIQKYYQFRFLADNVFRDTDGTTVDRKLNVAMTRAEEHLIMFGNAELLSRNTIFSRLMDFMKDRDCYFTVSQDDYLAGNFD